jgi:PAS domain S-box-containing protein
MREQEPVMRERVLVGTSAAEPATSDGRRRRSEQRWRVIAEQPELLIVELDTDGTIRYANPYLVRMTGRPRERLIGTDWLELVPAADRDGARSALAQVLSSQGHDVAVHPICTGDDESRPIWWFNTVVRDGGEAIDRVLVMGCDLMDVVRSARAHEREALTWELFDEVFVRLSEISMTLHAVLSTDSGVAARARVREALQELDETVSALRLTLV